MGSDFLRQFQAGFQMGQTRNENSRRNQELQMEQQRQQQQQEMRQAEYQLRLEEHKQARKQLDAQEHATKLQAAKEALLMRTEAAKMQGLPAPTAADVGIPEQSPEMAGPMASQVNVPQPMQAMPNPQKGQPDIQMPVPTGRQQQDMAAKAMRQKILDAFNIKRAEAKAAAQFRAPERPVSVSPGGTLVDPSTGKVLFRNPKAIDTGGADVAVGVAPGATGPDLMASLSAQDKANVQGLVDGKLDPRALASMRKDRREYLMGLASRVDPTFSMMDYANRAKTRQDFSTGKAAGNVRSLNTVMGHLKDFSEAANKLDNRSLQVWNRAVNAGLTQTGDSRVTNFEKYANAVVGELATLFKGTSGTDQEIQEWRKTISSAQSPAQLQDGVKTLVGLIGSRMNALSAQYQQGMGHEMKPDELLTPKSWEIYRKFSGEAASPPSAPTAPPGGMTGSGTAADPYRF